jgi:cobalt-zinc-cadmium efflux system outer membrane protein
MRSIPGFRSFSMHFLHWAPLGVFGALTAFGTFAAPAVPVSAPVSSASSSTGLPADLALALRDIWQSHPEVGEARAMVESARASARAASRPLYNPALQLDMENADVDRRTAGVNLTLDLSGKRRARAAEGEAGLRYAQAAYDRIRQDVASRWLKAWFAASMTERVRQIGSQRLELMQRFDALAARRLAVGDLSSPERDLAALALAEAQAQQAALIGKEAVAQASLRSLGGAGSVAGDIRPGLPPPLQLEAPGIPDGLPDLRVAHARADTARAGVIVAQREQRLDPTVGITGGKVRVAPGRSDNVIGLSLSIPLPVRNNFSAQVDAARANVDAAMAGVQSQQRIAQARLDESVSRYSALREASKSFDSSRAAAFTDRTGMLERLWKSGEISTSDYLVQLRQSLDTALSGLELRNDTWQAWIDFLGASGRLLEGDEDAGNSGARINGKEATP